MKTLIVTKYKENIDWLDDVVGWDIKIYDKDKDYPNIGREAETAIRFILDNYDNLNGYYCFLQGDPFAHYKGILELLTKNEFITPLFLGQELEEDNKASTYHPGLRLVAEYEEIFQQKSPEWFNFYEGGQFILTHKDIKKNSKEFYQRIYDMFDKYSDLPWCLERFWNLIF